MTREEKLELFCRRLGFRYPLPRPGTPEAGEMISNMPGEFEVTDQESLRLAGFEPALDGQDMFVSMPIRMWLEMFANPAKDTHKDRMN